MLVGATPDRAVGRQSVRSLLALGAIGLPSHTDHRSTAWTALVWPGLCVAGCYTVIEAWLQAKVTNETRGRAMGVYRFVDRGASLMAQMMIGVLASVETYIAYNLLTIICCASLLPLTLSRTSPPQTSGALRLRPALALTRSPLAVGGVLVAGLTSSAYRMVGPIYGAEVGLEPRDTGFSRPLSRAVRSRSIRQAGWRTGLNAMC